MGSVNCLVLPLPSTGEESIHSYLQFYLTIGGGGSLDMERWIPSRYGGMPAQYWFSFMGNYNPKLYQATKQC